MPKKRAPRGTGTVYERPERGDWTGQITFDGKRHTVYGKDKTAARAEISKLLKSGGEPKSKTSTVAVSEIVTDFLDRDLAGRERTPSTVAIHNWAAEYIRKQIGKKHAATLRVRDVDDMLDRLADDGLSRSALLKVRGTLSQSLRYAVKREDISRNVALDATIPPSAPRTGERTALSPSDARKLLEALRHERNGAMFALSLRLGLRPGEAAGLYWEDIGDDAVNVTRAVRLTKGRAEVVDDLKTEKAKRTIALTSDLVEWLRDHRIDQIAERMAASSWVDERLVFTSPTGHVTDPANNRRQLKAICKSADVPTVKPNELRHSCASLLADMGVMNEQIADLLGHTTTEMVDQTYRHRLRRVVSIAAEADWTQSSS